MRLVQSSFWQARLCLASFFDSMGKTMGKTMEKTAGKNGLGIILSLTGFSRGLSKTSRGLEQSHATAALLLPHNHPILPGRPFPQDVPSFPERRLLPRQDVRAPAASPLPGIQAWFLLPFFFATLAALNLGAFAASRFLFPAPEVLETPENLENPAIPAPAEPSGLSEGLSRDFLWEPEAGSDFVMDSFRDPETRDWVTGFFERICGSPKVAQAILEGAEQYSISPSLAFALSWEESRFNIQAVNKKNRDGSVDRGLFQLNNRSFPKLGEAEFFDPRLNARYGMAHLRICIDLGGSEIAALAMYNAGTGRVHAGGTPRQTLDYTAKVLSSRRKIDRVFLEEWTRRVSLAAVPPAAKDEAFSGDAPENAAPPPGRLRDLLPLLSPISR
jgi:hypothetical protein